MASNTSFASLKRNSKKSFEDLNKAVEALNSNPGNKEDDRFWQPTVDKNGTGSAVIRFLPAPAGEDMPFIRAFQHSFKGPGGWLIEECPTTIGRECPICNNNSELWNTGVKENQDIVRQRKRGLYFVSNIYVVKDPGNPDNEGKVFLYRYGKKIFDKLNDVMHPQFADEEERNPFDLWEGANFRLKIRKVDDYRNYDKSEFDAPSALFDDDEKLESIWKSEYPLQELIDPSKYKTNEDLTSRLNKALGLGKSTSAPKNMEEADEDEIPFEKEEPKAQKTKEAKKSPKKEPKVEESSKSSGDEDDDLEFFKQLAESDD